MSYFILYTQADCKYCKKAIKLLADRKKEYVTYDLGDSKIQINEAKKRFKWPTLPIILMAENKEKIFIGGYTDLKNFILFESGKKY